MRAVRNVSHALHTKSYRFDPAVRDIFAEHPTALIDDGEADQARDTRPYFEVLIVGGDDPDDHDGLARRLRKLRDPGDDFRLRVRDGGVLRGRGGGPGPQRRTAGGHCAGRIPVPLGDAAAEPGAVPGQSWGAEGATSACRCWR